MQVQQYLLLMKTVWSMMPHPRSYSSQGLLQHPRSWMGSRQRGLHPSKDHPESKQRLLEQMVQDKTDDEIASLKFKAKEPLHLEGQDKTLPVGPECTGVIVSVVPVKPERQDNIPALGSGDQACTKGVPGRALAQREEEEDGTALLGEREQSVERAEEVFESGKVEAVRADASSAAVQQEVLTAQDKGSDSAFLQAESMEALKVPVPAGAAAVEEHVMADDLTPTDVPAETVQPLATTSEQMASEEVQISAVEYSGRGTIALGNAETAEPQVSPASMNGISEEQERLQSTRRPEQNGILSDSLSLTAMKFAQDVVQSVTIESQSTQIVLNAIQTAVRKLSEAEELAAFEPEQYMESTGKSPLDTNISERLESMQVDRQLPVKEEERCSKEQELQQSGTVKTATLTESAESHATVEKTKDMLLTSEMLKDGQSQNSLTFVTSPEDVSRESVRLQKSTLELSTSQDSTKDLLDTHLPKLREKEAGQIMGIPDQHTRQQTCRESEEDHHHSPVEDGKRQTWEDVSCQEGTSCDSPQSQNSAVADALNMC